MFRKIPSKFSDIPGQLLIRGYRPNDNPKKKVSEEVLEVVTRSLGIEKLNTLQEKTLHGIQSDMNLFLVGPEGIGKTTAYLIPILIDLYEELKTGSSERPGSPMAFICCGSAERAMHLESFLQNIKFLQLPNGKSPVMVLDSYEEALSGNVAAEPFHILLATNSLLNCAFDYKESFQLSHLHIDFSSRMKYVVFEELGMQKSMYADEVARLLMYFDRNESMGLNDFQVMFSGTIWSPEIHRIYRNFFVFHNHGEMKKTAVIFESVFQAMNFSNVLWKVEHCQPDISRKVDKLISIYELLQGMKQNIVVVCSASDTAERVSDLLYRKGKIKSTLKIWGQNGVRNGVFRSIDDWGETIYVVSDDSLKLIDDEDISCVINFDIDTNIVEAKETDPIYAMRFACIWGKLGIGPSKDSHLKRELLVVALITDEDHNLIPLYNFLRDRKTAMPASLHQVAEQKILSIAASQPLCEALKCSGFCTKIDCPKRHKILLKDTHVIGPREGELEFKVVRCQSPSLYHVKLLRHFVLDENNQRKCVKVYRDELYKRMEALREHYRTFSKNRAHPLTVSCGEKFCVQSSTPGEEMFFRVQITKIIKKDEGSAEVVCLDTGSESRVPLRKLLVLPKEFQDVENYYVQVVLPNMLPASDNCNDFFITAYKAARSLSEGKIWHGKILLALENTIWMNPVVQLGIDPATGRPEKRTNLIAELVYGGYVGMLDHPLHMKTMQDHIRKVDPSFPEIQHELNSGVYEKCAEFHKTGDPVEWGNIGLGNTRMEDMVQNSVQVKVHCWIDPWEIYGSLEVSREENLLTPLVQLEMGLTEDVESNVLPRFRSNVSTSSIALGQNLVSGSVVAVKGGVEVGHRWQRGMILGRTDGEDVSLKYNVFLVDYGITKFGMIEIDQVLPLVKSYVEKMPFQAICIKLAHIQPLVKEKGWSDEDVEKLGCILSLSSNYVTVMGYGIVYNTRHPCNYYEAFLMQSEENDPLKDECIGLKLVQQNHACVTPSYQRLVSKMANRSKSLPSLGSRLRFIPNEDSISEEAQSNMDDDDLWGDIHTDKDDDTGSSSHTSLEMWNRFREESEEELPGPPIQEDLDQTLESIPLNDEKENTLANHEDQQYEAKEVVVDSSPPETDNDLEDNEPHGLGKFLDKVFNGWFSNFE